MRRANKENLPRTMREDFAGTSFPCQVEQLIGELEYLLESGSLFANISAVCLRKAARRRGFRYPVSCCPRESQCFELTGSPDLK